MRPLAALVVCGLALGAGCSPNASETDSASANDTPAGTKATVHEALAMPAQPTLNPADFRSAQVCAACHPNHAGEWATSRHAFAMKDPVFRKLVALRQTELDGREDQFCTQCHSPIGTRGGECVSGFDFASLSPIVLEGVTCETCHKASAIVRTHNSGLQIDPSGPLRAGIQEPTPNKTHDAAPTGLLSGANFCATCHDVYETSGVPLERPYAEWLESPAAAAGQTCQDCHMARYDGKAALTGPERKGLHRHRFVGADPPLTTATSDAQRAEMIAARDALMATAAEIRIDLDPAASAGTPLDVHVTAKNRITGHRLPTGTTFIRQVWLALTVTDAKGAMIYQTGDLDANGDLRDAFSELDPYGDHDLVTLGSRLIDAGGNPTRLSWRAVEHTSTTLAPLHERTWTFFVPVAADTPGPLAVKARLRFRAYPPHLLRLIGLEELVQDLEILELAAATTAVTVE